MSDGYAEHYTAQAELRKLVYDLTTPAIPLKKLAHAAGVNDQTLWSFRRGDRSLNPANERAVRAALRKLVEETR